MRFKGRSGLVTGAGGGIGAAVAGALAREGARLALCGRHQAALEIVRDQCTAFTDRAVAIPIDVRVEDSVRKGFDRAWTEVGPLDVVVACHGVNRLARVEELALPIWEEIIATNLTGTFLCVREAARRMRARGGGRIVLVSSVSGRPGYRKFPGFAAYSASKYAMTGLAEVVSAELAGSGVEVAVICPAGVDTDMFRRTFPGGRAELSASRVAEAILDLADPARASVQGLIVDLD